MKKYKIKAGETIYHTYETIVEAESKQQAEQIASEMHPQDYEDFNEESAGDFEIDTVEEGEE